MLKTTQLSVSCLKPNNYNPNKMTEGEFSELINEIKWLKRIPKPIVVRKNENGFIIVDGEHSWKAAKEVGLDNVTCEVIEADNFESMRQTYKRNQHGTHNPVLLGRMFQQMKEERSLSNRALAKEIEVSEGTIRNALLYMEAAKLRNDYAFEELSVQQIRYLPMLPERVRNLWLDSGADVLDLFNALIPANSPQLEKNGFINEFLSDYGIWEWPEGSSATEECFKKYHGYVDGGLLDTYFPNVSTGFLPLFRKADKYEQMEAAVFSKWFIKNQRELIEQWRKYMLSYFKCFSKDSTGHLNRILALVYDAEQKDFLITPKEFDEIIDRREFKDTGELLDLVKVTIYEKHNKYIEEDSRYNAVTLKARMQEIEMDANAPDYIKESPLITHLKYALWKASGPDWVKQELARKNYISSYSLQDDIYKLVQEKKTLDSYNKAWEEYEGKAETGLAELIGGMLHEKDADAARKAAEILMGLTKEELYVICQAVQAVSEEVGKQHRLIEAASKINMLMGNR